MGRLLEGEIDELPDLTNAEKIMTDFKLDEDSLGRLEFLFILGLGSFYEGLNVQESTGNRCVLGEFLQHGLIVTLSICRVRLGGCVLKDEGDH